MFTTKKYTRPALRKAVRSINVNNFTDVSTFVSALSPRAGRRSAQVKALREVINASLNSVLSEKFAPRENKQYLLSLLK